MNLPTTHVGRPLVIRKRLLNCVKIYRIRGRSAKIVINTKSGIKVVISQYLPSFFLRSITPYLIIYNCNNITEALIAEELLSFSTPLTFSQILVKNNYILDIGIGLMTFQRGRAVCFAGAAVFLDQAQITDLYDSQIKTSCYRWPEIKGYGWISGRGTIKPNKSQDPKRSPIDRWRGCSSSRLGVNLQNLCLLRVVRAESQYSYR